MRAASLAVFLLLAAAAAASAQDARPFASAPPRSSAEDYVVGAHDQLEIKVFEMQQLDRVVRVAADGTISLPLLGQVAVSGLTARGVEERIAALLRERNFVRDPQVSVFVKEYVSRRAFVQGAVTRPGHIDLLGERTLLDVIGEVGGLVSGADVRIFVIRPTDEGGREDRIEVDAERLVYQGDHTLNLPIRPGDVVIVPFRQEFQVYVNGAVGKPGHVPYRSGEVMTVLQAVTAAGGTNDRANESKVRVLRRGPNGAQEVFKVNLKRVKRGKDADMVLQRNDIVVVPESMF